MGIIAIKKRGKKIRTSTKYTLIVLGFIVCVVQNGCKEFAATDVQTSLSSSGNGDVTPQEPIDTTTPVTPTPSTEKTKTVFVGVGYGGIRITSEDGFRTFLDKKFDISGELNGASNPTCVDPEAVIINSRCCYNDKFSCYGSGAHSDFLFRGITYGNGRFVAVGGWTHGISQWSDDGVNWSEKLNWHRDLNIVGGTNRTYSNWLADVAYGKGLFVATSYGGYLFYSPDGQNWSNDSSGIFGPFRSITFIGTGFYAKGGGKWGFSSDGINWDSDGTFAEDRSVGDIAQKGNLVLGRLSAADGATEIVSLNKTTMVWSTISTIPAEVGSLIYAEDQGLFYTFARYKAFTSPDGITWTEKTTNHLGGTTNYAKGNFMSHKYNWSSTSSVFSTSTDGLNWVKVDDEGMGNDQKINIFTGGDVSAD